MPPQSTTSPEEWRPVIGYEEWYEVSNFGRIRRVHRRLRKISSEATARYPTVTLWRENQGKTYAIHRLVAEAFLGPAPPNCLVHHKNAVRADNRDTNLEYATQSRNISRAFQMGTKRPSGGRKIGPADVEVIKVSEEDTGVLAARYGVGRGAINAIRGVRCSCCSGGLHKRIGSPKRPSSGE